jgi:hypothetical protein
MIELRRYDDARKAIKRISSKNLMKVVSAKLLYHEKNFRQLAALKPANDEEKMWQLSGLAKSNIQKAGARLVALTNKVSFEEEQFRDIVQYYAAIGDSDNMNKAMRQLGDFNDKQVKRLKKAIDLAVDNKLDVRARSLLARLESIDPTTKDIKKLRQKVKALEAAAVASSKVANNSKDTEK